MMNRTMWLAMALGWHDTELADWSRTAAALITGEQEQTGRFEQFAGYDSLPPPPPNFRTPGLATARIGHEPDGNSQIIKQADVVMLLHLLWDRFSPVQREANFRYYEPRTLHGSSLSPGTHALVAARLGDLALAEAYFQITAGIDFDGGSGRSAFGMHMAAMGSLWQAAVFGVTETGLTLDPKMPASWSRLSFPFRLRRSSLTIAITHQTLAVTLVSGEAVTVSLGDHPGHDLAQGSLTATWTGACWQWLT